MSTDHQPGHEPGHDAVLAERYGRTARRTRQRRALVGAGVLVVAALAWLLWVLWFQTAPQVQSRLQGYDVVGPREATADVTVVLDDPSVTATCLVRATAADSSVVGERSFVVEGVEGPQRLAVDVRTEREATSVVMVGCTTPDQPRPR